MSTLLLLLLLNHYALSLLQSSGILKFKPSHSSYLLLSSTNPGHSHHWLITIFSTSFFPSPLLTKKKKRKKNLMTSTLCYLSLSTSVDPKVISSIPAQSFTLSYYLHELYHHQNLSLKLPTFWTPCSKLSAHLLYAYPPAIFHFLLLKLPINWHPPFLLDHSSHGFHSLLIQLEFH